MKMRQHYGKLTRAKIEGAFKKARQTGKRVVKSDGDHLALQVAPFGRSASWLFRSTDPRTHRERSPIVLRPCPVGIDDAWGSLDDAWELAEPYRQLVRKGKDPKKELNARQEEAKAAAGLVKTVEQVAREFYEQMIAHTVTTKQGKVRGRSKSYKRNTWYWIKDYIIKTIGNMAIQKVRSSTILKPTNEDGPGVGLSNLWVTQHPTAQRVQGLLDQMFEYAITCDYYSYPNPAAWARLKSALDESKYVHKETHRIELPWRDAHRFWQSLVAYRDLPRGSQQRMDRRRHKQVNDLHAAGKLSMRAIAKKLKLDYNTVYRIIHYKTPDPRQSTMIPWLKFALLTGARQGEVRQARWEEFDSGTIWWCPPEHRKEGEDSGACPGKDLPRPITRSMRIILDEQQKHRIDPSPDALVFPNRLGGEKGEASLSRFVRESLNWEIVIHAHGFRGTLRNWGRAKGKWGHTKEAAVFWDIQVDHTLGKGSSENYGHDMLVEERRPVMEEWDEHVTHLLATTANVVTLSDKRKKEGLKCTSSLRRPTSRPSNRCSAAFKLGCS